MSTSTLTRQLQELQLIQCSLLQDELFSFVGDYDGVDWQKLFDDYTDADTDDLQRSVPSSPCRFRLTTTDSPVQFEIELPKSYPGLPDDMPLVFVKGLNVGRAEQEKWQNVVKSKLGELQETELLVYELLIQHLLPLLHAEHQRQSELEPITRNAHPPPTISPSHPKNPGVYHALFTSHHLISPTKRRNLQKWSSELTLSGFAKVGHPGVIYCFGTQTNVEDFVMRVKDMQWLALRLRFAEPLTVLDADADSESVSTRTWIEFEKVGEVVDQMRKWKRESYVVDMGIGSAGVSISSK